MSLEPGAVPEPTERPKPHPEDHQDPPPGPADHGGKGGMATREKAPELARGDDPQD